MASLADEAPLRLADMTPCWLRDNYLRGLRIVDSTGQDWPDSFYLRHMRNAVRRIEVACDLNITVKQVIAEQHDYKSEEFSDYGFIQLFQAPLRSVEELRACYPTNVKATVYPNEWLRLERTHSQIQLVPTAGSLNSLIVSGSGSYAPILYNIANYMPQLWQVDYTCGMDPDNLDAIIGDAIGKMSVVEVLTVASDAARPVGVTSESASADGLSQSTSFQVPAFKHRIDQYNLALWGSAGPSQQPAGGLLKTICDFYRGINFTSA